MTNTTFTAQSQSKPDISDELENILADLEVARTFREALDNFLDELRLWMLPDGVSPCKALLPVVFHAQTMLVEMGVRVDSADQRTLDVLRAYGKDRTGA